MKRLVICTHCGDQWYEGMGSTWRSRIEQRSKISSYAYLCEDCHDYIALLNQIRERGMLG